jgi:hypothetical protein
MSKFCPTFIHFLWRGLNLIKFRKYLTIFKSHLTKICTNLSDIYIINWKIRRFYKISQNLTKFYRITWYNTLTLFNFNEFLLTFAFVFDDFKSLPQNFGLGDGKSWISQYCSYVLLGLGIYPMWLFHPVNSLVVTRNLWLILLSKIW